MIKQENSRTTAFISLLLAGCDDSGHFSSLLTEKTLAHFRHVSFNRTLCVCTFGEQRTLLLAADGQVILSSPTKSTSPGHETVAWFRQKDLDVWKLPNREATVIRKDIKDRLYH